MEISFWKERLWASGFGLQEGREVYFYVSLFLYIARKNRKDAKPARTHDSRNISSPNVELRTFVITTKRRADQKRPQIIPNTTTGFLFREIVLSMVVDIYVLSLFDRLLSLAAQRILISVQMPHNMAVAVTEHNIETMVNTNAMDAPTICIFLCLTIS
jgi:hypothetical protein